MTATTPHKGESASTFWIDRYVPGVAHWCRFPAFIGWLGVSCGIFAGSKLSGVLEIQQDLRSLYSFGILSAIFLFFSAGILLRPPWIRFLLFFLGGFILFQCTLSTERRVFDHVPPQKKLELRGSIVSPPLFRSGDFCFLVHVDSIEHSPGTPLLAGKVIRCLSRDAPAPFGKIHLAGIFSTPRKRVGPYGYDEYGFLLARGIWGTLDADTIYTCESGASVIRSVERALRQTVLAAIGEMQGADARAILQTAILNENEYLPGDVEDLFKISGLYHLLSISGLHTAMIMGAFLFFFSFFPLSKSTRILLTLAILWLYLLFIGFIPSLFRATVMATCISASFLVQRRTHAIGALGFAGTLWLIISPRSLFLPGFQLSFAATFGIIALQPVLQRAVPHHRNPALRFLLEKCFSAFYISAAGFLSTAPILLYHFGMLPLYGLASNLLAVPLMTVTMWLFFAGLLAELAIPALAWIPMAGANHCIDWILWIAGGAHFTPLSSELYRVPYLEVLVLYSVVFLGVCAVRKDLLRRFLAFATPSALVLIPLIFYLHRWGDIVEVVRFTPEKSSFAAIRWPGDKIWVFCSGKSRYVARDFRDAVAPWLRHLPESRLELVALGSSSADAMGKYLTENHYPDCAEMILPEAHSTFTNNQPNSFRFQAAVSAEYSPARSCTTRFVRSGDTLIARVNAFQDSLVCVWKKNSPLEIIYGLGADSTAVLRIKPDSPPNSPGASARNPVFF